MKNILTFIACLVLTIHLSSCTSKDTQEEDFAEVTADGSGLEGGDLESVPESGNSDEANAGFLDEQLPEESLDGGAQSGDTMAQSGDLAAPEGTLPPDDNNAALDPSQQPLDLPVTDAPTDGVATAETQTMDSTPPVDPGAVVDPGTGEASGEPSGEVSAATTPETPIEEPPKPVASLRKVESMPFKRTAKGDLLNAVYITRPGDTFQSISERIYGSKDKVRALKKNNPSIKTVKSGQKLYYNSPSRPTDDTRLANFYEDQGMMPESYIAKEGDNLRSISSDLLGYKDAWKEIWSTNSVESKTDLAAGTEIRYWKGGPTEAPKTVAMNMPELPELPPAPPIEAAPPAMADFPPPPEMAMPQDLPPPPPPEMAMPPPPPPQEFEQKKQPVAVAPPAGGLDPDMVLALTVAGGAAVLLAGLMMYRRRKAQRDLQASFGDTQVGT